MKKYLLVFLILLSVSNTAFCKQVEETKLSPSGSEEVESSLKKVLGTIVTITGSIYIKILATVSLIYIAVKLIISQDKREFLKKVYGWILACFLVNLTPAIVNKVFEIKDSMKSLQTFSLIDTPSYGDIKKKK